MRSRGLAYFTPNPAKLYLDPQPLTNTFKLKTKHALPKTPSPNLPNVTPPPAPAGTMWVADVGGSNRSHVLRLLQHRLVMGLGV